jgi:formyl-CoA transferase
VLDFSQVLAGPYCTMMLGDFGCDVIKVEHPVGGDPSRGQPGDEWQAAGFDAVNRNKRSIVLDLHHPKALGIVEQLVRGSDVLVESFRPSTAEKFGIGYDHLSNVNPRLVYASISGYGSTGPLASRGGYDIMAQAMSGIMSVTGEEGGPPLKAGVALTDAAAGLFCLTGILSALLMRTVTGCGQRVETSLFEAGLGLSVWEATELWARGSTPGPHGSAHRMSAPYQALAASDGYFTLAALNSRQWKAATEALGHPEWFDDSRFQTNDGRLENRVLLVRLMEDVTRRKPAEHWVERLNARGVPAALVLDYGAAFAHPQAIARSMTTVIESGGRRFNSVGPAVKLSDVPDIVRLPPPRLGEHTEEVLQELGYDSADISALRQGRAI